jgi:dTDP-4-amino-4,6-dideoxygalactose transaminase
MQSIPLFKVHMPETAGAALQRTLASGHIAQGAQVVEFERAMERVLHTPLLCAVSDASAGLTLALFLSGVRPGDEVIVSPLCCLATAMPIANLFARPVWCDVDPGTGMPDAKHVRERLSERTRAVIVYCWSGNPCFTGPVRQVARGAKVVVDASEAFGAELNGLPLTADGADFTVYSFSAVRHITTGEGGIVAADSRESIERAKRARRYGIEQTAFRLANGDLNPASDIDMAGYNFAMNNIAATIGLAQIDHVAPVVSRYRENGRYFDQALAGIPGINLLQMPHAATSAHWTYSFRAERRGDLMRKLHENRIGAQRLHLRTDLYACFAGSREAAPLPGVGILDRENLSIPCGWWVTDADRARIADCIRSGW